MASTSKVGNHIDSCRISSVLSYAVLEWSLMLLLFLNAAFSYLVTKFARFCKLQTPCLLCSRLDHIFGHENPGFYRDLICEFHKSEISLLSYCHVHQKLANAHEMCEGCLTMFAAEKQSNPDMHRSLADEIGSDSDESIGDFNLPNSCHGVDVEETPLLKKDPDSDYLVADNCSCCSVPLRNKLDSVSLLQNKLTKDYVDRNVISFSKFPGPTHHQAGLNTILEESPSSTLIDHSGNRGIDHEFRIEYSEVNGTSDSESEIPFLNNDGGIIVGHEVGDVKEDVMDRGLPPMPDNVVPNRLPATLSDDASLEKSIHAAPITLDSGFPIPEKQLVDIGMSNDVSSMASTVAIEHGLEEINWNKIEVRNNPPAPCQTTSEKVLSEAAEAKSLSEDPNVACFSTTSSELASKSLSSSEVNLKIIQTTSDLCLSVPTNMDLNDAYKLVTGYKSNLASPSVSEVITGRDSFRVYEDLRILISQMSTARGLESPWNDLSPSPRFQGQGDDIKFSDASSTAVLQNITKRISIDRNESGLESLDGSIVSEIEGESVVDRLKRQLELDRKSLSLLYKELEEERSASAIAANQAMAMITRLQEEKAAMQMEALQYQRMMEEQAEYDQEALQKSNELLAEREKDIQDLEADIESYSKQFGDKSLDVDVRKPFDHSLAVENNHTAALDNKFRFRFSSKFEQAESANLDDPLLGFEDEKAYILDCLKMLEEKLHLFSRFDMEKYVHLNKPCEDDSDKINQQTNGQYSDVGTRSIYLEQTQWSILPQEHNHMAGGVLSKDSSLSREDSNAKTSSSLSSPGTIKSYYKETFISSASNNGSMASRTDVKESNFAALQLEVSHLNERLEALEGDLKFLEHTINSLKNGDSGIQFVQEMASDLRELRRICMARREHSVA
ncbi:myosin-binding protein 1-like [Iris pallida]|uniref:Myosin-binding protein 1-like n=1 Tax=Iris pallida TaxID=29817 RepID=A0AAX6HKK9_IRIPA|nr:myosin-binding protein 1-like [Iris pallida]